MLNRKQRKIALYYLVLQALIWVKTSAFFFLYSFGRVTKWNKQFFPPGAITLDFFFHESMHLAIGLLALWFGKNIKELTPTKLVQVIAIVFTAVAVHNLAYWFTASHKSLAYSATDFARDGLLLLLAVLAGYALKKLHAKLAR